MKTWQVVGTSWKVALRSSGVMGIVGAIAVVLGLLKLLISLQEQQGALTVVLPKLFLQLVETLVYLAFQGGCLTFANAMVAKAPAQVPVADFWRGARHLYGRLLGLWVLLVSSVSVYAFVTAIILPNLLRGAETASATPAALVVSMLLILAPGGIVVYLCMLIGTMTPAAFAVENIGVMKGVKRGLEIGRATLTKLMLVSLALMFTLLPTLIFSIPQFLRELGMAVMPGFLFLGVVFQGLVAGLSAVLYSVALVQIYRHQVGIHQDALQ